MTPDTTAPGVGDALRFGRDAVLARLGTTVALFAVPVGLLVAGTVALSTSVIAPAVDLLRVQAEARAAAARAGGAFAGTSWGITPGALGALLGAVVALQVVAVLLQVLGARFGLALVDGARTGARDLRAPRGLGRPLATAVLLAVLTAVGTLLLSLPGVVVALLGQYAVLLSFDRGFGPVTALRESTRLASRHPGTTVLLALAVALVGVAGWLACGVGLVVAYPVGCATTAWLYRRLDGLPARPGERPVG
ncbi:hypothetical protein [Cellulosimicrobium cellulans]|uniref:hypothetical protein n=1 Tax=Cellulosimicrobium cellulans TaxID=1710 RepID=UPI00130DFAB5|nr:hypothetical protein [Cellulosimicrobium cellulans]